jgi:type IV secretion system protein VirB4
MADLNNNPLFKGGTRPPMKFGVTMEILFLIATVFVVIPFVIYSLSHVKGFLYFMASAPFAYIYARLMCAKDPMYFTIMFLRLRTKGNKKHNEYWGANSLMPVAYKKREKSK